MQQQSFLSLPELAVPVRTTVIEFDGGTSCNIPRLGYGVGYGSYRLNKGPVVRCQFGNMSANSAEILTLCEAIKAVPGDVGLIQLRIEGDSQIALTRAINYRKPLKKKLGGSPEFQEAVHELRRLLQQFHSVETHWRGRAVSVEVFGH